MVSCPSRSGSIQEQIMEPARAGRDRRIRTTASRLQRPLPCAAWLCLRVAGLSRLSSISRPSHTWSTSRSCQRSTLFLAMLLSYPLYTTAAPRLERVTSTRLVVAPTIPTPLGNRFKLYLTWHHYLQRASLGMQLIRLNCSKAAVLFQLSPPAVVAPRRPPKAPIQFLRPERN